jgi:hypothetical protein
LACNKNIKDDDDDNSSSNEKNNMEDEEEKQHLLPHPWNYEPSIHPIVVDFVFILHGMYDCLQLKVFQ